MLHPLIDKMYKNKSGSDIDKKLEMLEGMKSELDAYQENQSKYEPDRWTFSNFTLIACVPKFSSISLAISLKNSTLDS
jgi:hypothetical protein